MFTVNEYQEWWPTLDNMRLDRTVVMVLNTDIDNPPKVVSRLWNESWLRVTVDGGTNRWYNFVKQNEFSYLKIPDLITGDLDSADPSIIEQFVSNGSMIVHTPDQYETDFFKALIEVKKLSEKNQKTIDSIIVMVSMSHRIDHFLENINTLYKSKVDQCYFDEEIYLLGRNSLSWLLQAGRHRIHIPQSLRSFPEKNYVGMFPLGSVCDECTTTGLKWNLYRDTMEMGGFTSSSNTYNKDHPFVTIANSSPILWTMTMGFEESF